MATKKTVDQLSSDELYLLAQQREQEEQEKEKEAAREQLEKLREKRRALVAKQRKELAKIDVEIRALGGKTRAKGQGKGSGKRGMASGVYDIIKAAGKISTSDLRSELENRGLASDGLSQTLSYLKRAKRIKSPARAVYSAT